MQRARAILQTSAALGLAACAGAWLVGRVLSDRYAWSQPVSWIPPMVLAAPVWAACAIGLARAAGRRGAGRAAAGRNRVGLAFALLFGAVSAGHLAFVELGVHRVVRGEARGGEPVRVVFWNQAGRAVGDISPAFLARDPGLLILANRHSKTHTRDIAQAFIDSGEAHAAVGWPFDLFSRVPISRWASTSLGLDGRSRTGDGSTRPDPGWAAWFEVESDAGPLVVWAIDLPSDPGLARYPLAQQAGRAIAAWQGSVRVIEGGTQSRARAAAAGFPAPDIIVGDFNIPRRSASIGAFLDAAGVPGMQSAFDAAGVGWRRTWPRRAPVWAIDQCLVREGLAVSSFTTPDPGFGGHRMLVVEIAPD